MRTQSLTCGDVFDAGNSSDEELNHSPQKRLRRRKSPPDQALLPREHVPGRRRSSIGLDTLACGLGLRSSQPPSTVCDTNLPDPAVTTRRRSSIGIDAIASSLSSLTVRTASGLASLLARKRPSNSAPGPSDDAMPAGADAASTALPKWVEPPSSLDIELDDVADIAADPVNGSSWSSIMDFHP